MADLFARLVADMLEPLRSAYGPWALAASLTGVVLTVAATLVRTMVPLRALTVGANCFLLVAALLGKELGQVVLYLALIPANTWRLIEIRRLTRRVEEAAAHRDTSGMWLRDFMRPRRMKAGEVLFAKGDPADSIYMVVDGDVELVEIAKRVPHGEIFGEIACFSPERVRTLTARCATKCTVLSITKEAFEQLYFQEPKLAFHVSNLIADRLSADIARLRRELDAARAR